MGRWRSRAADLPALDLAPYRLIEAAAFLGCETAPIDVSAETTRRIERACLGLALLILALIVAKTSGAL